MKFVAIDPLTNVAMSLPVRGAWVEITEYGINRVITNVAPRAGSVG